jgi:mono/diheme cytochrome c family protein
VSSRGAIAGLVVAFIVLAGWTARSQPAQSGRSVWDGVYTEPQAARGQQIFGGTCARCHTVEDFSGDSFLTSWQGSAAVDLFQLMQKTMPMDNPGSLEPQEYADVIAYFFRVNQFPPGMAELDTDPEHLKLIRIERKK